jgi:hypothetical protein
VNIAAIAAEDRTLPPILNKLTGAKRQFYEAHSITDKRRLRFDILDATAELAMVELARSKLSFGLLVDESDEAAMTRLAELDRAMKEMGAVREQIAAARRPKTKASEQDETLERLTERFNDPKEPTFVWQLDFAEVFHRFAGARTGDLAPEESEAVAQKPTQTSQSQKCGFDIMLGNPPYVLLQDTNRDDELLQQFKAIYSVAAYKVDLYHLFIEKGIKLLNEAGSIAFITPANFASNNYAVRLRRFILESTTLRKVIFFHDDVFEASVNNLVFTGQKSRIPNSSVEFCRGTIGVPSVSVRNVENPRSSAKSAGRAAIPEDRQAGGGFEDQPVSAGASASV